MKVNKVYYDFINTLFLLLLTFFLYYSIINGFWRWDDPQILLHAISNSAIDYFFNPQVWQKLSNSNLTPWVTLSFDLDFFLFGLNPEFFYIHHIISLGLVSVSCYFLLRLWVNRNVALMGSALFLCGSPVTVVVQQLMTRHYIEGLLFSILSLYFYIKFLRNNKKIFISISLVLYVLSISSKEIYVPLILLLPFISENKINFRLKAVFPFFIILLGYIFWRNYMLSSLIGGYSENNSFLSANAFFLAFDSFINIPSLIMGKLYLLAVFSYLLVILFYIKKTGSKLILTFILVILVLLPLIPLVIKPGISSPDRYLLLVWFLISFSFSFYFGKIIETNINNIQLIILSCLYLLFFYTSIESSKKIFKGIYSAGVEFDTQLRFIWEKKENVSIFPVGELRHSFWSITGIKGIKKIAQGASSPVIIFDNIHYINTKNSVFKYNNSCFCMKDFNMKLLKYNLQNKKNAPLSVYLTYNDDVIGWKFGPYAEGQYSVVFKDPNGFYPLPLEGELRTTLKDKLKLYIKYTSKSGWFTYSPEFYLKENSSVISWNRYK